MDIGNADGLGLTRRTELARSYGVLGVDESKVDVLDHPYVVDATRYASPRISNGLFRELQDSITQAWNTSLVARIVKEYVEQHSIASVRVFSLVTSVRASLHTSFECDALVCAVYHNHLHFPSKIHPYLGILRLSISNAHAPT